MTKTINVDYIHVDYISTIIFPPNLSYSQVAFYVKYYVLTFSLEVVSTLPNCI